MMRAHDEKWAPVPIPEMAPYYSVSSRGRIRSERTGRISRPGPHGGGYLLAHLYADGKRVARTVHRLVALAFIPNPEGLPEVNHIDFNKTNNRVENLEWCTRTVNVRHFLTANPDTPCNRGAVVAIPDKGGVGWYYPSQVSAEIHMRGRQTGGVSHALREDRPAYGYVWRRT